MQETSYFKDATEEDYITRVRHDLNTQKRISPFKVSPHRVHAKSVFLIPACTDRVEDTTNEEIYVYLGCLLVELHTGLCPTLPFGPRRATMVNPNDFQVSLMQSGFQEERKELAKSEDYLMQIVVCGVKLKHNSSTSSKVGECSIVGERSQKSYHNSSKLTNWLCDSSLNNGKLL